jgi:hypothetical protein
MAPRRPGSEAWRDGRLLRRSSRDAGPAPSAPGPQPKKDPGRAGVLVSTVLLAQGDQNVTLQLLM